MMKNPHIKAFVRQLTKQMEAGLISSLENHEGRVVSDEEIWTHGHTLEEEDGVLALKFKGTIMLLAESVDEVIVIRWVNSAHDPSSTKTKRKKFKEKS